MVSTKRLFSCVPLSATGIPPAMLLELHYYYRVASSSQSHFCLSCILRRLVQTEGASTTTRRRLSLIIAPSTPPITHRVLDARDEASAAAAAPVE